ncbi:MAG TPA: cytochrome c biogenesis protein CcsA [Candidatus Thermoplasmatota archaeon]|nr:cytochrome c biogenesis protein CcsA [Candidatus Thermoplasmatota archaeon]
MTWAGPLLLSGSLVAALAAVALTLRSAREPALAPLARRATLLSLALLALAALVLVVAFVTVDVSYYYVWNYTDASTPLYLRIAGLWAGQAGSAFLWTIFVGAAVAYEERLQDRHPVGGPAFRAALRAVALAVLCAFVVWTITLDPFAPSSQYHLSAFTGFFERVPDYAGAVPAVCAPGARPTTCAPQGFGLNPLLTTPFMAVHPPIQLAAYALVVPLFAAACAFLATDDPAWSRVAKAWGRIAWLLFALGLGIGALWAYYVLSFGGFWAWDPVEVGDLLPWIALTGLLHATVVHERKGGLGWYLPLLAALPLLLTLLATFVTRSALWISAHAFDVGTSAIVPDPFERAMIVLSTKPAVSYVASLLFLATFVVGALFLLRFRRLRPAELSRLDAPVAVLAGLYLVLGLVGALDPARLVAGALSAAHALGLGNLVLGFGALGVLLVGVPLAAMVRALPEGSDEHSSQGWLASITETQLLHGAVVLLSLGLAVTASVLLLGVNLSIPSMAAFYNSREPFVVVPLALLLAFTFTHRRLGRAGALAMVVATLGAGLAGYALFPSHRLLALGAPILLFALFAAVHKVVATGASGSAASRETRWAGALLVLASLLGVLFWASPPTVLSLPGATVALSLWQVPVGLAASALAFAAGVATMHGRSRALALLGGAAGVLAFGYGVGLALSVVALALSLSGRASFDRAGVASSLRASRAKLFGAAQHLGHVGLVLILVGYGASTFHATTSDFRDLVNPLERGVPASVAGYDLLFSDSTGVDADGDGVFEEVTAHVQVWREGRYLDTATVTLYWVAKERQHRATEYVLRQPFGDLYVNANTTNVPRMRVSEADCAGELRERFNCWVNAGTLAQFTVRGDNPRFPSDRVDRVQVSVKHLPLVSPVWAGAFLLPVSMVAVLALDPRRR